MPNLRLVGLVYKDSPEVAQQWLGKHGNPYRHLLLDAEGKAGIDWGVYGVPETFVMDRQGIVRHKITGALTMTELTHTLLPLLQKLP
jgi:cytochrome c biogenesis protein CcmG/thiol:disulfide interchange protein DsbE